MSDILREHVSTFGFSHSEIARRATKLNQATAYRVVEGDTTNPSLNSITGIIEAITLTDADAGVLYRRMGVHQAKPRQYAPPEGVQSHEDAALYTKNNLDAGYIREAAYGVMAMFDLASNESQLCDAYEQAGIVYMGLGKWEESQVNFEAADAQLQYNIEDPTITQKQVNRKHTLMTNIGSLMTKRGNATWAVLFGKAVIEHPRVSETNRGWGYLVIGEADLALGATQQAVDAFEKALVIFTKQRQKSHATPTHLPDGLVDLNRERAIKQAQGNIRWTEVHLAVCRLQLGDQQAGFALQEMEANWLSIDPEASTMAGFFYAKNIQNKSRRLLTLRDLQRRAKRYNLGEIVKRIGLLLSCLVICGFMLNDSSLLSPSNLIQGIETAGKTSAHTPNVSARGNTGG